MCIIFVFMDQGGEIEAWCYEKRLKRLLVMHDMMFEHYSKELCGDMQVLLKIKSFWDYMEG